MWVRMVRRNRRQSGDGKECVSYTPITGECRMSTESWRPTCTRLATLRLDVFHSRVTIHACSDLPPRLSIAEEGPIKPSLSLRAKWEAWMRPLVLPRKHRLSPATLCVVISDWAANVWGNLTGYSECSYVESNWWRTEYNPCKGGHLPPRISCTRLWLGGTELVPTSKEDALLRCHAEMQSQLSHQQSQGSGQGSGFSQAEHNGMVGVA